MSAGALLQAAVVAALRGEPALADLAVFDAEPVRGGLPHAVVEDPVLRRIDAAGLTMREARLAVVLSDAGERPTRLRTLCTLVEALAEGVGGELGEGWRAVRVTLVRSRILRAREGRWIAASEFVATLYRANS